MFLAFVAAMRNVRLEDVAVAGFQLFQDAAPVYHSGAAVVGECAEKDGVFAIFGIHGAKLAEVFSQ